MDSVIARLFMIQWFFDILSGSWCIIWQSSSMVTMVNCPADTRTQSLGSPRSWLKTGCSKQRPKKLRQISPRKLQAVISSQPTRYLGGNSCTWHILLETPKGVTKEPTHLACQRKWKQSNETCSLPHHMAWPLHRRASKLYACAAALVARRQPAQVSREASRNALHIHRLTDGLSMLCSKLAGTAQPTQPSEDATTMEAVIAAPRSAPDALSRTPWEDTATWR